MESNYSKNINGYVRLTSLDLISQIQNSIRRSWPKKALRDASSFDHANPNFVTVLVKGLR